MYSYEKTGLRALVCTSRPYNKFMAREDMVALYAQDFFEWTARNAELLRQGRVEEADLEHVAEEIEDLGKRYRHEIKSRLVVLVVHLLKWKLQPERRYSPSGSSSWLRTIIEQRGQLADLLEEAPSLKRYAEEALNDAHRRAVKEASAETGIPVARFPAECPFRFDQVLEDEFLPE
jgi:hypothetical protein